MRCFKLFFSVLLAFFVVLSCLYSPAQTAAAPNASLNTSNDPCNMPTAFKSATEPNLFNAQQEEWLGDIMDKSIRRDFNIIEDPEGYLQKLGESLLAKLPPTGIHYHFVIIDSPELNSFGMAGGRIYIHRRMIAFSQNEDEFAALLGHEIGHIVDHHVAIRMTRWLKELGVTAVGDQQDVYAKWNFFTDNARRVKDHGDARREQEEQLIADRISLYAVTRAGYNPARYIDFADRLLATKHNTGGFWSDFFGTTTPESKRLREIVKNAEPLAKTCIAPSTADAAHYHKWQQSILESGRVVAKAELPGLVRKVSLQPQLRGDIGTLEFSLDGKYLLAQDASSVFVLTREPLANLFRIDALDAHSAQFTPDSRSIVFYDKELRVEKWDIASRQRTWIRQVTVPECFQSALSPTGEALGCIDNELGLRLVDVNTDKVIYERKKFYELTFREYYSFLFAVLGGAPLRLFDLKFSPDGRYFAASHREANFVYDFKAGAEMHLPLRTKNLMEGTFVFLSPEEIAGIQFNGNNTKLIRARFPSGEKTDEFKFQADGWLSNTGSNDYLLVRPAGAYPVGIVDLKARKIGLAFKNTALAIRENTFAGEQNSGEVALFNPADSKLIAKIQLPDSPLPPSRVSAFSPDGKWLAVSGGTRGSLWKLDSGERVLFTLGFEGGLFENDLFIAKFPKLVPNPSRVFRFDPITKAPTKLYDILNDAQHINNRSFQMGSVVIILHPENEKDKQELYSGHVVMEVHDVRNNNLLWERKLQKGRPGFFYSGNILTLLTSDWDGIKDAAKEDAALNSSLSSMDDKHDAYLLQAFDVTNGKLLGFVLVDTGKLSFRVFSAFTFGEKMFVGDSNNRTLVYSLKTGVQKGKLLGRVVTASPNGDRVLVENGNGVVDLYDTGTLQPLAHFAFPGRIADAEFTANSTLMVLTADQSVYQLNLSAEQAASGPK